MRNKICCVALQSEEFRRDVDMRSAFQQDANLIRSCSVLRLGIVEESLCLE